MTWVSADEEEGSGLQVTAVMGVMTVPAQALPPPP